MFSPLSNQIIAVWQDIGSWQVISKTHHKECQGSVKIYVTHSPHGFTFILEDKNGARNEILHIQGWISPDQVAENNREPLYKMLRPLLSSDKSSVIFSIFEQAINIRGHGKVVCFAENKGLHFQFLPSSGDPFKMQNVKGSPIPTYDDIFNLNSKTLRLKVANCGAKLCGNCLIFYQMQYQLFVKNLKGKTIIIPIAKEDTIKTVMQRIAEKEGISPREQRLIFSGQSLDPERTVEDYCIKPGTTINLVLRLRGGGGELLSFADVSKEIRIGLDWGEAPSWSMIAPGLNLVGKCVNENCPANDQTVYIQKGIGTFNMNKECNLATCPECNKPAADVNNCGFFSCTFSIKAIKEDGNEENRLDVEAPDNEFLTFESSSGAMDQYRSLTITTAPLSPGGCTLF